MCLSDRASCHTFHTSPPRYGSRKALWHKGVPYLPYLPYLFPWARVRACRRVHEGARRPVRARMRLTHFRYGRYGRYGRGPQDKGFGAPYLGVDVWKVWNPR